MPEDRPKLQIAAFTPRAIRPEPRRARAVVVDARPGWGAGAVRAAKNIGARFGLRRGRGKEDDAKSVRSLVAKTAICAAIVLLMLLVKHIDSPFTNAVAREVKSAVSTQTELDREIGRLKFVQGLFGSEPVLSDIVARAVYPVEGKVVKGFGEDGSRGVAIESALYSPVLCAASGQVASVRKADAGYTVRVKSQNGTEIFYKGIVPKVKEGESVAKGAVLGTLKGNTLVLEAYRNGTAVDPISLLEHGGLQKE